MGEDSLCFVFFLLAKQKLKAHPSRKSGLFQYYKRCAKYTLHSQFFVKFGCRLQQNSGLFAPKSLINFISNFNTSELLAISDSQKIT